MEKHILVGIDGSPASMAAVKYLGSIFGKGARVKIDLLHILPDIPDLFLEPGESMAEMVQIQDFAERVSEQNRRKAAALLEEATGILTGAGIHPANIRPLVKESSAGVARDILGLEQEGIYDGIVLGRHGMSAVEEFFMGSVTHKVLQHTQGLILCVTHGKIESGKILVPIDSSPNSKRVLDHVAWLLTEAGPMAVTILHVLAPLIVRDVTLMWTGLAELESTIEQRLIDDAEEMLSQAKTYLMESDVPTFAIKTRLETRAAGVARTILKEAKEGGYGSIMIGRRGVSRTERFLFGSVSNKIVQQARDIAVWVIS
jgi:nucleotide-binding universal stress UspA family protein